MVLFKRHSVSSVRAVIILISIVLSTSSFGQNEEFDSGFNAAIHTLVKSKPDVYAELDVLFKTYENDTLKMKRMAVMSNSINYALGESYAFNALGNMYRNASKYEQAIDFHQKALTLAVEVENTNLTIICLNMMGVDYRRMDMIRSALDYHSQALNLAQLVEDPTIDIKQSIAVSLNSMGNIYLALKQYNLALIQFHKSLAIEQELGGTLGLAINYHNIGFAKEGQGLLEEALKDYETSLAYNNELDSEVGRSICMNSMGEVFIKQGELEKAYEYIETALSKARMVNDQFYIGTSMASFGSVNFELGRTDEAQTYLNEAISIAQSFGLKSIEITARQHLSKLFASIGDHESALSELETATELEKTITNERNLNYINDLVLLYESDSKSDRIKALTDENLIVKSRLEKFQLFLLIGVLGTLLSVIVFAIYNRTRKLQQEKKILTLEQDMLRSQMNPHFIFNSLNSIKLYIINNEKENAVYYLNKFAKLIRKILVASNEKDIQLSDELDTMALYMNIENIRFSNEIDFQISIADNVNPESIRVPSLILQPFLENALWHGLSSKKDDKKITLDVKQETDKYVTITITDNGVGRAASKEIKEQKTLNRKSVGIALTKERLENFSKGFSDTYNIQIIDLHDQEGIPNGTEVVLNIPIRSMILESA